MRSDNREANFQTFESRTPRAVDADLWKLNEKVGLVPHYSMHSRLVFHHSMSVSAFIGTMPSFLCIFFFLVS